MSLWQAAELKLSESSLGGGQDVEQGPMAPSYRQQEALLWSPEAMSRGMTGSPFQPRWPSNTDKIKGSISSASSMVVLSTG